MHESRHDLIHKEPDPCNTGGITYLWRGQKSENPSVSSLGHTSAQHVAYGCQVDLVMDDVKINA